MNRNKIILGSVILIALICVFIFAFKNEDKPLEIKTEKIEKGSIQNSITATGTIEPVTSVTVGTQVSGIVSKLYVDYNSVVTKGQVIAELDKTNLVSELNNAKANLNAAQSTLDYERNNFGRYKTLFEKGLVSADDYEQAQLSLRKAQESATQAREAVNKAQTNLGYATITSPIDGVVLSKSVEEGQTVAASFNTPELFTIAQNLTDMRVIADIDEADIGEVKEGERVVFTVDAYANDTFEGVVTQVRQEAITTNNVVTYEVVISAPNANLKLKPGLTANVTIYTAEKTNVTYVPQKALRFTPAKEILGSKYVIADCDGKNKVWTIEGNTLKAHALQTGLTDGIHTEVLGGIAIGTSVITEISVEEEAKEENTTTEQSPFAPGPHGKKK